MSAPKPPVWAPNAGVVNRKDGVYLAIESQMGVTTVVAVWEDHQWRRPQTVKIELIPLETE